MGDMLIRGIDADMRRRLEVSAQRNGRSLSEEAIALMREAMATLPPPKAGDHLRSLVSGGYFTREEVDLIEAARKESDRTPPELQ